MFWDASKGSHVEHHNARYEDGPNFFYFVLYLQKQIAIAVYMAAFSTCHGSCHKIKEELSSLKCHLNLFYKVQEPLPSDWYVSWQPAVFSPALWLESWKSYLTSCCRGSFLWPPIYMQMQFSTPEEFPISYEAKNSYWSRDSKIKALVHSASFMYNGKEMKGTLSLA